MDWTEKHRPTEFTDVVGNKSTLKKLRSWADGWSSKDTPAVTLVGPPGVGKTTAAHALAKGMGWPTVEMNASETRTKDVVNHVAGSAASSGTLTSGTSGRRLVILDEADSLHGNNDRGGTRAMGKVIKNASQPVILIANDYYGMSDGLRNATKKLEFDEVDESDIVHHLSQICETEGIECTMELLEKIASRAKGDVRGAVKDLQAVAMRSQSDRIDVADMSGGRDKGVDMWTFLDSVLQTASVSEAHKLAIQVGETPDDLLQWVEENVVSDYNEGELNEAYANLSRADKWLGIVMATQNYSFWRYVNDEITAGVAAARKGTHRQWTKWGAPSRWQKLGSTSASRGIDSDLATQIAKESDVSIATAEDIYLPYIKTATHLCKNRNLTVDIAGKFGLEEKEVSHITGSGKDTNKVAEIVEDAMTPDIEEGEQPDADDQSATKSEEDDDGLKQATLF